MTNNDSRHRYPLSIVQKGFNILFCMPLLLALPGCGGGGSGDAAEAVVTPEGPPMIPPPENPPVITPPPPAEGTLDCNSNVPAKGSDIAVSPGGIFYGTFFDCATGKRAYATAMVGEDGVFRISSYDNEIYNLAGLLKTDGDSFQGSSRSFTEPTVSDQLWLEGVITQRKSLEGRWGDEWGSYGYFELAYSLAYEWPDAWTSLMQYRELSEAQNGTRFKWTITKDGQISGSGTTGLTWDTTICDYSGQAVQIDPRYNLFNIEYTATGCPMAGSYSGLATVIMMGDDTFQAPVLQFQVDDGAGAQAVVRLFGYY